MTHLEKVKIKEDRERTKNKRLSYHGGDANLAFELQFLLADLRMDPDFADRQLQTDPDASSIILTTPFDAQTKSEEPINTETSSPSKTSESEEVKEKEEKEDKEELNSTSKSSNRISSRMSKKLEFSVPPKPSNPPPKRPINETKLKNNESQTSFRKDTFLSLRNAPELKSDFSDLDKMLDEFASTN